MGLFVGPNGLWKTVSAASFYEAKPDKKIFFFDFDGRINPVKLIYPDADIQYETYGPRDLLKFKNDFERVSDDPAYWLLVMDSFTSLSVTAITFQMEMKGVGIPVFSKGQNAPDGLKRLKGGLIVPGWDEFNGEAMIITSIIDACKVSNKSIIFNAHPITRTEIGQEGDKLKKYRAIVAFGPKVADMVPGYFNEVYSFSKVPAISNMEKDRYIVSTTATDDAPGKTALPLSKTHFDITEKSLYRVLRDDLKNKGINFLGGM